MGILLWTGRVLTWQVTAPWVRVRYEIAPCPSRSHTKKFDLVEDALAEHEVCKAWEIERT